MQVIAAAAPASRSVRVALVRSGLVSVLLLLAGGLIAWVLLTTPLLAGFIPTGRPTIAQAVAGIVAWAFAIVVPSGFLIIGLARIVGTVEHLLGLRPRTLMPRLAKSLGPEHLAISDLVLPGGRRIHELVLGPFGIVILGDVPPPGYSRHLAGKWELRDGRGRWIPIEAPLDRASRDAERVRGWLATDDRDFLVKVYAAIVTTDRRVERTPTCAVVAPGDLVAWLAALPAQRGLTADRREQIAELLRSIVVSR